MKTCKDCLETKELRFFGVKSGNIGGLSHVCKFCRSAAQIKYQKENKDLVNAKNRQWCGKNRDKARASSLKWVNNHIKKVYQDNKIWRANNKKKCNSYTRSYQAKKLNATPNWLTKEQIIEMQLLYENRPENHHVDHIIPLQGENVSGLHVPWNLQYLEKSENLRKGNKVS